jgi:hypothetical protein
MQRRLFTLIIVGGILVAPVLRAQGAPLLSDVAPAVRVDRLTLAPYDPSSSRAHALLENGLAVLSRNGQTIRLYEESGALRGESTSEVPLDFLDSPASGEVFMGLRRLSEDEVVHVLFGLDGRPLWQRTLGSVLRFSPSGAFLYTTFDVIDSSQHPAVFDALSGEEVWSSVAVPYWQMAVAANDTMAFYTPKELQLINLETGEAHWSRRVDGDSKHDLGSVTISLNGERIATRTHLDVESDWRVRLRVTGRDGRTLWERTSRPVTDVTNGGTLQGFSDDGRLLAVRDIGSLSVLRSADGEVVSSLEEPRLCCITAFTRDLLVLRPIPGKTRFLRLADTGEIRNDSTLDVALKFIYKVEKQSAKGAVALGSYQALQTERSSGEIRLSHLRLEH